VIPFFKERESSFLLFYALLVLLSFNTSRNPMHRREAKEIQKLFFIFPLFQRKKKTILKNQIVKIFCLLLELEKLIDQNIFQSSKKIQKI
jgi:hypothetical protein